MPQRQSRPCLPLPLTDCRAWPSFKIELGFKDSQGRTWHVKGWVDVSLSGVKAYNIDITDPNGNTTHFEGTVKSLPGGGFNVSGTLTDENGNVIIITKDMEQFLIELTEFVQTNL